MKHDEESFSPGEGVEVRTGEPAWSVRLCVFPHSEPSTAQILVGISLGLLSNPSPRRKTHRVPPVKRRHPVRVLHLGRYFVRVNSMRRF